MSANYTIGLDYGTNSVRALIVNVANGAEIAAAVWTYAHGTQGVVLSRDPNLARQHPADYLAGAAITIQQALRQAKKNQRGFRADQIIGIGVDTTGSTSGSARNRLNISARIRRAWLRVRLTRQW